MRAIEYSHQLIWAFPPLSGDDLMGWRCMKDRMTPPPSWFFSSQESLNRKKAYLELHSCDPSCQIGQNTQIYMGQDIIYPPHSDLLESMSLLENTIKSFNEGSLLVETGEGYPVTDRSHPILDLIIFFKIEDGIVTSSLADGAKEALPGFLFVEAAAKFESIYFGFSYPIGQFKSYFTDILSILSNGGLSSLDKVLSTSWIFCDDSGNLIFSQVARIFREVIPCISDDGIDLFHQRRIRLSRIIYGPEVFLRFFGQFFEKPLIPFISWRYLDSQRDRELCIGDLQMGLIAKEAEVFAFSAPGSLGIRFFGFDVRGTDEEPEVFFFEEANRVIAFSPLIGGFIFGEIVDEGEGDVLVRVICG